MGIIMQSRFNTCAGAGGYKQSSKEAISPLSYFLENRENKSSAAYAPQSITYLSHFVLGCHYYGPCVSHTSKMKELEDRYEKNNTVLPNCAFCCLTILCSLIHILIREVVAENQGLLLTEYTSGGAPGHAYAHMHPDYSP